MMSILHKGEMMEKSEKHQIKSRQEKIYALVMLAVWAVIITVCLINRNNITVDGIVNFTPKQLLPAFGLFMLFFALKSISIVMYSGILFAASELIFPTSIALAVNLCGAFVMFSVPYFIGRKAGAGAVAFISEKYPKTAVIKEIRAKNNVVFVLLVRLIGFLPFDVVSIYMGAVKIRYSAYALGSLVGTLPMITLFQLMGDSINDPTSPQFLIAASVQVALTLTSSLISVLFIRSRMNNRKDGE